MTDFHELHPKIQRFNQLCATHRIPLDPEYGDRACYQGHVYLIAAVEGHKIALTDDVTGVPIREDQTVNLTDWESDPAFFYLPSLESLLHLIHQISSVYPSLTPGVQDSKPIWRVLHPNTQPIYRDSVLEALIDLAIVLLEE